MERKLILYIATSLDGYIARTNGEIDWLEKEGEALNTDCGYAEFYKSIDTVIMGNKTYEQIMGWGEYPYKGTTGYVYTTNSNLDTEDVSFTQLEPTELMRELKSKPGKDIWLIGGAKLIREFVKSNLIDEYIITVMPVLIGDGIHLFEANDIEDIRLELKESKVFDNVVQYHYVKRKVK